MMAKAATYGDARVNETIASVASSLITPTKDATRRRDVIVILPIGRREIDITFFGRDASSYSKRKVFKS